MEEKPLYKYDYTLSNLHYNLFQAESMLVHHWQFLARDYTETYEELYKLHKQIVKSIASYEKLLIKLMEEQQ